MRPLVDHPGVLQSGMKNALDTLLSEHERITGERIVLALFRSTAGADPAQKATELFNAWQLNSSLTRGNSVLLVFFWKEREAHIEIGYGMEAVLPEKEAERIISEFLIRDLDSSGPNRALGLTVFELLRTLESPLVKSGEAERALRSAGFQGPWAPAPRQPLWLWILGFAASGGLLLFTLYWLTSAEVHFSRYGNFRLRPWELGNWKKPLIRLGILRSKSPRPEHLGTGGGTHGNW
ncbi:MAG: hypothetical protein A2X94_16585 [Bdellovibrionales bacterium GWB1_55_8]|nr:MAG: hypothetical protein A2X94_16585 [Bdellovibrionales bacterium GWB1_55_8]